jgi:hypothetical protein
MKRLSGRIIPDYTAGYRRIGWQDVSGFPGRITPDYVIKIEKINLNEFIAINSQIYRL